MTDISAAMAYLCRNYGDLQMLAADTSPDAVAALSAIVELARSGGDITEPLRTLVRAVDGPEDLGRQATLPGVAAHSADEVYRCPAGRCRIELRREPGSPWPRCVVENDQELVLGHG